MDQTLIIMILGTAAVVCNYHYQSILQCGTLDLAVNTCLCKANFTHCVNFIDKLKCFEKEALNFLEKKRLAKLFSRSYYYEVSSSFMAQLLLQMPH